MSALIHPKTITVDGLSVRYAEGGQDGPDAILMSPWPESVYAFEPAWPHLAAAAHLVAIDPPGFGGSDYRQTLMNPKAMGQFILNVADALGLDNPHIVGPDIGTSSVLFAAAAERDRFRSIVVGSGGAAVPLDVTGVLKEWIEAPDLDPYRQMGGRKIVEIALRTIAGYTPSDEIREDYMSCYEGNRFADTIPYAQSYREYLPELAKLLPGIQTPVRIVAGADDQVVPASNADFLHERLPNSQVDLIAGAGHFCWEEKPAEYAALLTNWWDRANAASKKLNQLRRVRMSDSSQIALIRKLYGARGNVNVFKSLLADDLEYDIAEGFPNGGVYRGIDAVVNDFFAFFADFDEFYAEGDEYFESGDHVIVLGRYFGLTKKGRRVQSRFAHFWTLRDGKVLRLQQTADTLLIARALEKK